MSKAIRKKTTRRRPKRTDDIVIRYVVEIVSWDWGYSFGINYDKRDVDPYMEFRHLEILGRLIRPSEINGEAVELSLLPTVRLNRDRREKDQPAAVGSLRRNGARLLGLLSLPEDVLPSILTALAAKHLRFIDLAGEPLRRNQALVRSFRLQQHDELDED